MPTGLPLGRISAEKGKQRKKRVNIQTLRYLVFTAHWHVRSWLEVRRKDLLPAQNQKPGAFLVKAYKIMSGLEREDKEDFSLCHNPGGRLAVQQSGWTKGSTSSLST